MTRIRLKGDDELDPTTRELFEGMVRRGGKVPDLYRVLAHSPELLQAWTSFAWPLRNVDHADRALRELLILRTAQLTGATYEWAHHWPMALAAGATAAQLEALASWRDSPLFEPAARAALGLADELVRSGDSSDAAFAAVREHFDEKATIQIALTVAFYVCVARFAGAVELDLEPGYEAIPPLPKL